MYRFLAPVYFGHKAPRRNIYVSSCTLKNSSTLSRSLLYLGVTLSLVLTQIPFIFHANRFVSLNFVILMSLNVTYITLGGRFHVNIGTTISAVLVGYSLLSSIVGVAPFQGLKNSLMLSMIIMFAAGPVGTVLKYCPTKLFFAVACAGLGYVVLTLITLPFSIDPNTNWPAGATGNRYNSSLLLGFYSMFLLIGAFQTSQSRNWRSIFLCFYTISVGLIFTIRARVGIYILAGFSLLFTLNYIGSIKTMRKKIELFVLFLLTITLLVCMAYLFAKPYIIWALERGLTGRTAIVEALWSDLSGRYLLGYGFGALDTRAAELTHLHVRDAHSIVATAYDGGIPLLLLFGSLLLVAVWMLFQQRQRVLRRNALLVALVVLTLPSGTTLLNFHEFTTMFSFWLLIGAHSFSSESETHQSTFRNRYDLHHEQS